MKRPALIFFVVLLPIFLLVSLCSGIGKMAYDKQNECLPANTPGLEEFKATSLSGAGLTVKGVKPSVEQSKNIRVLARLAQTETDHPIEAFIAMFIGASQEATVRNVDYGYPGSTSRGMWQQIAAWGPESIRTNVEASTKMFLKGGMAGQSGMLDYPNWWKESPGQAVQNVQRSDPAQLRNIDPARANREAVKAYEQHLPEARAFAKKIFGSAGASDFSGTVASTVASADSDELPAECTDDAKPDRIEKMVEAAEARVGKSADDESGAELVSQSAKSADITLPSSYEKLLKFRQDKDNGVTAKFIDANQLDGGKGLRRGDIVFYLENGEKKTGFYLGTSGGTIRIATFNILGSTHPAPVSWPERMNRSIAEINRYKPDVLGLQELRLNQHNQLLKSSIGKQYDIYPDTPQFGKGNYGDSPNSILWRKDRFKRVNQRYLPLDCYFQGCGVTIPAVMLEELSSGNTFWVINTHDTAGRQYADQRLRSSQLHRKSMLELRDEFGVPVVMTGDLNSGFWMRQSSGNQTYQGNRNNLSWCVLTQGGDIQNAYDAWKNRSGPCPRATERERVFTIDHIYATSDVSVDSYKIVKRPKYANGADHPLVYADTRMPGTSSASQAKSMIVSVSDGKKVVRQSTPTTLLSALRLTATDISPVSASVGGTGKWVFPMKKGTYSYRSNSYGPRIHPVTGRADFHNGTDFSAACGTPLTAMNNGKVVQAKYSGAWGNYVIIDYGKVMSMYAHMPAIPSGIRDGATVDSGQNVGSVGTTGLSTGCHLHLNIGDSLKMLYGDKVGTQDPIPFLASVGIKP